MRVFRTSQSTYGLVLGIMFGIIIVSILHHCQVDQITFRYDTNNQTFYSEPVIFNDMKQLYPDKQDAVARALGEKVRVLCWVMTQPKTLETKASAVKETWGKRCNVLLFFSSEENKQFPVVGLDVPEGRENLWLKTRAAWSYVFAHHLRDADWFIKADDDTFVFLENLRYFLSAYNTTKPHYFGRHFVKYNGYNSGGCGYVFSKETLYRFVRMVRDPSRCRLKSIAEDKEVGVCLREAGVVPGDTRDQMARETFHPFEPGFHLIPGAIPDDNWLHEFNKWEVKTGPDCCSSHSIAFHYIPPNLMYMIDFYTYHIRAFGRIHIE